MVKRRWVRESDELGLVEKRFRPAGPKKKRTVDRASLILLPTMVLADLRGGNIRSLDAYLKMHRGIPHKAVLVELRKLLSGSSERTKYRLIAVEHPNGPAPKVGRRAKLGAQQPTAEQLEVVAAYERALPLERGKKSLAEENAAKSTGTNKTKVQRARRAVADYENARKEADAGGWKVTEEQIRAFTAQLRSRAGRS